MRRPWLIALLLAAVTLAIYWPVHSFDLIYFDDPLVMTDCPAVQGLTWASLKWALTSVVIANWHPVTNLSFLAISQCCGPGTGPQHVANALIHAANAALLFLVLRRLTGSIGRSAVVAALFAWHPLRVESVAWIVERKDVLCASFFLLALWFYGGYVDRLRSSQPAVKRWLTASLGAFMLALLCKPMAVTLPFVLLLLDFWPLRRLTGCEANGRAWWQLVREKWSFFGVMLAFCVATYWIQHDYAAMTPWEKLGLAPRVANAIAGYLAYPAQLCWPLHLAAIYPYPKDFDLTETALKALLLAALTAGCLSQWKKRPQLAVGWCWYLGTALPIIGIVQVGEQAMADRYTYLPLIGPVAALVWTFADWGKTRRGGQTMLAVFTALLLPALIWLTTRQLEYWRNTIALFSHNLVVTPDNGSAAFTLGLGYEHAGDTNRAFTCYRAAKLMSPNDLQIRQNLGLLLSKQGDLAAAETEFQELLALDPANFSAHSGLANLMEQQGRFTEEIVQLNEAIRSNPESAEAMNNLAWLLATCSQTEQRDPVRAVALAEQACTLTRREKTIYLGTLAAAYASAGRFEEAITTAEQACALAQKQGETDLLQRNQALLDRYRNHQPAVAP